MMEVASISLLIGWIMVSATLVLGTIFKGIAWSFKELRRRL